MSIVRHEIRKISDDNRGQPIKSILFSWYAADFDSYNKTYGSLGAAIGFMTWIWISCMVILAGALTR